MRLLRWGKGCDSVHMWEIVTRMVLSCTFFPDSCSDALIMFLVSSSGCKFNPWAREFEIMSKTGWLIIAARPLLVKLEPCQYPPPPSFVYLCCAVTSGNEMQLFLLLFSYSGALREKLQKCVPQVFGCGASPRNSIRMLGSHSSIAPPSCASSLFRDLPPPPYYGNVFHQSVKLKPRTEESGIHLTWTHWPLFIDVAMTAAGWNVAMDQPAVRLI